MPSYSRLIVFVSFSFLKSVSLSLSALFPFSSTHSSYTFPYLISDYSSPPLTLHRSVLPSPSGPVRHQCRVLRRRDGASDADADSGGVHAVGRGFLQRF